jgi:hypothetical protein
MGRGLPGAGRRALAAGRQIVILRKGGIVEAGGEFRPDFSEFLLFPTYAHQSPESVLPEARISFAEMEKEQPEAGKIVIRHAATVVDVSRVDRLESLRALRGEHVWSDAVVEERFHRWREDSVWAMIVRVLRLPDPVTLELKGSYAGCKSWITLDDDVSTAGARAIIGDEEFAGRFSSLRTNPPPPSDRASSGRAGPP